MGAAPLSALPGLTNSAPQFTVNRASKGDRLPMAPAVQLRQCSMVGAD
jgi:hypothetical protein